MDQTLSLTALRVALAKNTPGIHHCDQGVQYASHAYIYLLKIFGIRISMAVVGKVEENVFAEQVICTIKAEEFYLSKYFSFSDAAQQI